ncbi:pyruvate/2-oxoglutarate dehydrogenase complex dihydrolipoamide dehydrogenase (E3) component [Granulicella aggregans]|uniref:Pyruvate/2-oxoglutarate dehydrogenase complex dihydrolipoamide dehydrogenase (E3) component n=1 Tax=Granulicella aggregans TaxID=474949 RepID=A0A7W7ZGT8_9BACT|nr:FAD-containing oxidoreductase [Granulicella aggregans]MBB5059664.1 pyruvate/2-oxoglutarate dehydrogenase complex dihydrolipoamide dehydrogenase (E3) component [Granulicella aggregans]
MPITYDAIVIGAGQAGPALTARLSAAGKKVALVERKLLGGTCVNVGCTPTKAMVASAHTAHVARRAGEFGVIAAAEVSVNLQKVIERKNQIVANSRAGLEKWMAGLDNCTVYHGHAGFESAASVSVGDQVLEAKQIFLNVGARPVTSIDGADSVPYLTSSTILDLDELPDHLVVIGGSYIGLEFAQMFRRFGSEVTVVERSARLLPHEDEDVSAGIREILEAEGIQIRLEAKCLKLTGSAGNVGVGLDCSHGALEIEGSHILLAIGRKPNTDDLNLAAAGIVVDEHGYIVTDEHLRTNVDGIFAMGDVNGRGAFTHTSWNDYEIVADNLLDYGTRSTKDRFPVYALYIDPPMAHIGMTEAEVRKAGRAALIGKRPMTRVGRAVEKGESQGFMKVLVDAETRQILGATILGVGGDEAIHCLLTCMYSKQPIDLIARSVHIHPTVSELIPTMLQELKPLT